MFSFFNNPLKGVSNRLTTASNNYIDWSRTAEILSSKTPHYTCEQITLRSAMILTSVSCAYLATTYQDENTSYFYTTVAAITAGIMGLTASHIFPVGPLFFKRYTASKDCERLIKQIHYQANEIPDITESLQPLLQYIQQLSLANEKKSNASLTWGKRKSLLNNLYLALENRDEEFLDLLRNDQTVSVLIEKLEKNINNFSLSS